MPPGETDSLSIRQSLARSDGFFQLLRGAEGDLLAGLDLDRLAGRGVAAHARGALAHLQDAEAADADAVALLQMLDDIVDHAAEDRLGVLLRQLVLLGDHRREVLQRNGGSSRLGGRHGERLLLSDRWKHASYARPISDSWRRGYAKCNRKKLGRPTCCESTGYSSRS